MDELVLIGFIINWCHHGRSSLLSNFFFANSCEIRITQAIATYEQNKKKFFLTTERASVKRVNCDDFSDIYESPHKLIAN